MASDATLRGSKPAGDMRARIHTFRTSRTPFFDLLGVLQEVGARSRSASAEVHVMRWWSTALAAPGTTLWQRCSRIGIVAVAACLSIGVAGSAAAPLRSQATVYTGYGFDTCEAPSQATLTAWLASPYRALGIYIGGANRACANTNLTSTWVASAQSTGWDLLPLYVGLQAPCVGKASLAKVGAATAATQGAAAADDAAARAAAIGLPAGSPLYFDMEGYATKNATCTQTVQTFLSSWVAELHAVGFTAGVYGSAASTIRDLQPLATTASSPDDVWIADWDGRAAVFGDPYVNDDLWTSHQRLHQYRGGHKETYGGVTLNIDNNYVDGAAVGLASGPPVTPPSSPQPTPGFPAGSVASGDAQATVSWPDGAFTQPVVVTLLPSIPSQTPPGFGAGGYGVQLSVSVSATGAPVTRFTTPLAIHIVPQTAGLAPMYSTDGTNWKPLPELSSAAVGTGQQAGYVEGTGGSFDIETAVAGFFALLPDRQRPAAPAELDGRFANGSLVLTWPQSTDNSGAITSYRVTLSNAPVRSLPAASTSASVHGFHVDGPSVYRVIAVDPAGNTSRPSDPVVVLPTKRPGSVPHALPRWAWELYDWQRAGKSGPRPPRAPRITPSWYWAWDAWRLDPFHIRP
jgi:Domain of unknown function (DUF1906)